MTDDAPRVVILGAGLAGLSASLHLRRAGVAHRIVERAAHPGGLATTTEEIGYRFDHTGHLLHLRDPAMRELALSLLPTGSFLEIDRKSVVYSHGVYTRYPFQANTFGLPPEVIYECVLGFVKASSTKPETPPRNFEEFCLAHFGEGISRHFMIPYNSRLWGVHPRDITAEWCARFVPLPKLEDVIAGAVDHTTRELGYNTRFLYPRLGMGAFAEALAERALPVETSTAPKAISTRARTLTWEDGSATPYSELISSIPLPRLVELFDDAPSEVVSAAKSLRATSLYYLDVALNTPAGKPYHWVYVPEAKYPFYRVGCYSNFSAAMAPPGKGSLYIELVDRSPPDLPRLLPVVADALVEMGWIRAREAIRFARARFIEHAYVIFDDAHTPSVELIHDFLSKVGITSVGRYGVWGYSSMEDALIGGRTAAAKVIGQAP